MIIIAVILVIAVLGIYILYTYNNLVKTKNLVDEAFSTMDVYLKKRWDLIPNLVEIVKGYSNYEKETLTMTIKLNLNNGLSEKITKLMAISEAYPELKANEEYMNLSQELIKVENEIAHSRKYYNGIIRIINDKILTFPSNIVAKIFKFEKLSMFEITQEQRKNVNIEV